MSKTRMMNKANRHAEWKHLTPLLLETLEYFWQYSETYRFFPTYREAGRHFGVSQSAIEHRMWSLEKLGYIKKDYKSFRALRFVKDRRSWRLPSEDEVREIRSAQGIMAHRNRK